MSKTAGDLATIANYYIESLLRSAILATAWLLVTSLIWQSVCPTVQAVGLVQEVVDSSDGKVWL